MLHDVGLLSLLLTLTLTVTESIWQFKPEPKIYFIVHVQITAIIHGIPRVAVAVDIKFPIHIHIHIHIFCVDNIHIHRCLSCMDISTECRWRQSLVGFYQLLENIQKQMFAILMKPKKVTLLSPHIWTYMNVVVTCKFTLNSSIVSYRKFVRPNGLFGCQHNKNLTNKTTVKQTFAESLNNFRPTQPDVCPVFHLRTHQLQFPSSTSSHCQKSPNVPSSFCTFFHTGSWPTFSLRHCLSLLCEQHADLTKSLPVHSDDTSGVTIQFKWLRNIHGYIHGFIHDIHIHGNPGDTTL